MAHPAATILVTKFVATGPRHKGGVSSWEKIERDLRNLLRDSGAAGITTLLDYYQLPSNTPGMSDRPNGQPSARVQHVEQAIATKVNDRRLRPYLMLHEFEAMLFTDITKWEHHFDDVSGIAALKRDVGTTPPEAINETPHGAPSKRLTTHLQDYSKVLHGPLATKDIGLEAIREVCPHFADWLTWAEGLSATRDGPGSSMQ